MTNNTVFHEMTTNTNHLRAGNSHQFTDNVNFCTEYHRDGSVTVLSRPNQTKQECGPDEMNGCSKIKAPSLAKSYVVHVDSDGQAINHPRQYIDIINRKSSKSYCLMKQLLYDTFGLFMLFFCIFALVVACIVQTLENQSTNTKCSMFGPLVEGCLWPKLNSIIKLVLIAISLMFYNSFFLILICTSWKKTSNKTGYKPLTIAAYENLIKFGIIGLKALSIFWLIDCCIDLHSLYQSFLFCDHKMEQDNQFSLC